MVNELETDLPPHAHEADDEEVEFHPRESHPEDFTEEVEVD